MANTKVLVVGKGFIGQQMSNFLATDDKLEVHQIDSSQVNYRDYNTLCNFLEDFAENGTQFDALINAAGYTGEKNVDDAEKEKELVWLLNAVLPTTLASAAQASNIPYFFNISSGCIFTGYTKPDPFVGYTEEEIPNFGLFDDDSSFYSKTKHAGELALTSSFNCYNLRIRMPVGEIYHKKNLISKMLKYDTILNEDNSATYMYDLMNFVYNAILSPPPFGIYNIVSSNAFRAKDLFVAFNNNKEELIQEGLLPENWSLDKIKFVTEKAFYKKGVTAVKRSNCILNNNTASDLGLHEFTIVDHNFLDKIVKGYIEDKKAKEAEPQNVVDISEIKSNEDI
jgi:dTDP-4-dehydrorhamnose reductase